MRPITVVASGPGPSAMVRLDEWAAAPIGVQVSVAGVANYTVQHTSDDPNDLINPVPVGSIFWDSSLVPAAGVGGTAGTTFSFPAGPLWVRLLMNSGTGSAKMVVTQYT